MTWKPKLHEEGTILFHDINVRENNFVYGLGRIKKDNEFYILNLIMGRTRDSNTIYKQIRFAGSYKKKQKNLAMQRIALRQTE